MLEGTLETGIGAGWITKTEGCNERTPYGFMMAISNDLDSA